MSFYLIFREFMKIYGFFKGIFFFTNSSNSVGWFDKSLIIFVRPNYALSPCILDLILQVMTEFVHDLEKEETVEAKVKVGNQSM